MGRDAFFCGLPFVLLVRLFVGAFEMGKIIFLWLASCLCCWKQGRRRANASRLESWNESDGYYVSGADKADGAHRRDAEALLAAAEAPPE